MNDTTQRSVAAALKRRLAPLLRRAGLGFRRAAVDALPRVRLGQEHVAHCSLVLDRETLLKRIGPRDVVAELGVNRGDFSAELLRIMRPNRLHLVDLWGTDRYHDGLYQSVCSRFEAQIAKEQVQVHRKRSTDAAADFADASFDLVYIDTDHSYATTRDELLAWAPKMKPGGILAGHDYIMGNWISAYRYGVIEAVHEFCVQHRWEIIFLTADPLESNSFALRKLPAKEADG